MRVFDEKMTAIADTIRELTHIPDKLSLDAMPNAIHSVYGCGENAGIELGKEAEYDRFWDIFQDNGNRTNYDYVFAYWTDDLFKPKHPIVLTGNSYNMFDKSKVSYIDESLVDCSEATHIQYFLSNNKSGKPVTAIMDIASCKNMVNAFIYSSNVETVELKNIREDCVFGNSFLQAAVVNFRCTGTIGTNLSITSRRLSDESVQNITDHLKNLIGQTTQTLTVHQEVRNRMTEEQVHTIVDVKNWTLAPAASTN